jgi:hypothetical protein
VVSVGRAIFLMADNSRPSETASSEEDGGLAARKNLPGLRQELITVGEPIDADLKSLKRAVTCPADALATD